jgi:membrane associated rhomboid family serine protease
MSATTDPITKRTRGAIQAEGVRVVLAMAAVMWVVEVINSLDHDALDRDGGIYARNLGKIWAVFTAPFLHVSFSHLIDNTIPFIIMGVIIAMRGATRVALVTAIVVVIGGLGTWLFSPAGIPTVGASGVVFGYAAYLLARGFFNHSLLELGIGAVVAVVWGTALMYSLVPHAGISWQGHLAGATGGIVAAWLLTDDKGKGSAASPPGSPVRVR